MNDINLKIQNIKPRFIRNIDEYGISDFKNKLSYEMWDNVFENNDVNSIYTSFLNMIFKSILIKFPSKKTNY
jgi:hypothetical protein